MRGRIYRWRTIWWWLVGMVVGVGIPGFRLPINKMFIEMGRVARASTKPRNRGRSASSSVRSGSGTEHGSTITVQRWRHPTILITAVVGLLFLLCCCSFGPGQTDPAHLHGRR